MAEVKKKILVLGLQGMAGHVITTYLKQFECFEVNSLARTSEPIEPDFICDVTNFSLLEEIILASVPDIIVNCIGVLNKTAEENPDLAVLLNSYLPHYLEAKTKNSITRVIHISTDCVFSGSKGAYKENDFKDGKGFYAQSKALGEISNNKDLTVRTSIIGPELKDGIGLFYWFMHQSGKIKGYTNAIWSGVTTLELAKAIKVLIDEKTSGLIHLTNDNPISKFDLLSIIKAEFQKNDITIEPDDSYEADKSLINTRTDIQLNVPGYGEMICALREWMDMHPSFYRYKFNQNEPKISA